jgi:hypothetical protein
MLDNKGYRHTLGICNTYCFSMATLVAQTLLNVTFIHTLSVLFCIFDISGRERRRLNCYAVCKYRAVVLKLFLLTAQYSLPQGIAAH